MPFPFAMWKPSGAPAFNPATLSLTGWWRAAYGGAPWAGTASAGASGAKSLTAGTAPGTGVSLNGLTVADFNGTTQFLQDVVDTWGNLISTAAYTYALLFNVDTTIAQAGAPYNDASFLCDTGGGALGVGFSTSGIRAWHYDGIAYQGVTVACATAGWHCAFVTYDGVNISVSVDSGAASTVAAASVASGTGTSITVGTRWDGTVFIDGKVAEIMTANTTLSGANLTSIKSYFNSRYGLAL